jgi:hypothetical protein
MAKNIDGIKKLSKEELEKSRKIVLDSIGETQKLDKKNLDKLTETTKSVDSLSAKKNLTILSKNNSVATDFLRPQDSETKDNINAKTKKEKRIENNVKNKARDIDNKFENKISRVNPFKSTVVDKRIEEEEKSIKTKKENKKKEDALKKINIENKKKLKIQKKEDKAEKRKRARERKKVKQKERKEKVSRIYNKINSALKGFANSFKVSFRVIILMCLLGVVLSVMLYSALLIVVVEYKFDNKVLRKISEYLPIPAYVSRDGIISFYDYIDIKNKLINQYEEQDLLERAVKMTVLENIIVNNLADKFKINFINSDDDILEKKNILSLLIMQDNTINQVGLSRINKIKALINEEGDFVKTANKYGDSQDKITISIKDNENLPEYFDKIKNMEIGEVSDVINDEAGYYIYRCFDKRNDNLYLSYVYVKGKTLDEYIKETSSKYRLWSLVD